MIVETTAATGLSFEKSGEVFFESSQDDIATLLLALLCHSHAIPGSVLRCSTLTASQATLLLLYRPAEVSASLAEHAAVEVLDAAGIRASVTSACDRLDAGEGDSPAIVDLCSQTESPVAFRDRLRMHLLAALQKKGRLGEDWLAVSPETCLGDGGGGT